MGAELHLENQFYMGTFVFVFIIVAMVVVNCSNFYLLGTPKPFADGFFSLAWKTVPQVILMCAV